MNIDELRSVQSKERQTDSLQHLRESFYSDVSAYVSELEQQRADAAEGADDPFADPEVRQLTDEIETAREVVEAIYERRLGKLVKRASLAAAGMPADEGGLTEEERELFDDLVERMEDNKARVLDVLDADDPGVDDVPDPRDKSGGEAADAGAERGAQEAAAVASPEPGDADSREGGSTEGFDSSSTEEHGSVPSDEESDAPGLTTRTTVRITGDVDEFYGVDDREYDLEAEDVVTLPEENAEPLLQSGSAERLD